MSKDEILKQLNVKLAVSKVERDLMIGNMFTIHDFSDERKQKHFDTFENILTSLEYYSIQDNE